MYIKTIQDTLNVRVNKEYSIWAAHCDASTKYKVAGCELFTEDSKVIEETLLIRESNDHFPPNNIIVGKLSGHPVSMDYYGNLYCCNHGYKKLDKTMVDFCVTH